MVRRGRARRYPALAVYGAWIRVLTGRPEDAERWLALADGATSTSPLVGRQRHDRALGRHPAREHDVERCRAGARRRRPGADQLPPGSGGSPSRSLSRGVAHALLGATDRAAAGPHRRHRGGAGAGAVEDVFVAHAQLALLAAKQGAWSEAESERGRRRRSSTRRGSATIRRARSRTSRRRASRCTTGDARMPVRR